MERDTRLQGILYICLAVSLYLKGPKKRASPHVPQKRGPFGNRRPFQAHFLWFTKCDGTNGLWLNSVTWKTLVSIFSKKHEMVCGTE